MNRSELDAAARMLSRLYPRPQDAAEVVRSAGLPAELLRGARLHRTALSFWSQAVEVAHQLGRVPALLHAARTRYGRGAKPLLLASNQADRAAIFLPLLVAGLATGIVSALAAYVFTTPPLPTAVSMELLPTPATDEPPRSVRRLALSNLPDLPAARAPMAPPERATRRAEATPETSDASPDGVGSLATATASPAGYRPGAPPSGGTPPALADPLPDAPKEDAPKEDAAQHGRAYGRVDDRGGNARESNPPGTSLDAPRRF